MSEAKKFDYRPIVGYLLSFLIFLLLLAGALALFFRGTVMNSRYVLRQIEGSEYTRLMTQQLQDQMTDWGAVSGVTDPGVFTDIITLERVSADSVRYFENALEGRGGLDTTELQQALHDAIKTYALQGGTSIVTEEELENNISRLTELCVDGYRQGVAVGLVPQLGKTLHRAARWTELAALFCFLLAVLLAAVLLGLFRRLSAMLRFLIYALTAFLLVWWGSLIWVRASGIIYRVGLTSRPLYTLATDFLSALVGRAVIFGAVGTVLLMAAAVGCGLLSRKK